jgi:Ser/Thr protein kinase RdoA (MazF antagonist)
MSTIGYKIFEGEENMRYGIENNREWIKKTVLFPVQSSVLDEEELFSEVVKEYCISDPITCRFLSRGDTDIYRVKTLKRNYYLKIYRPPKTLDSAETEASFVWALSNFGAKVVKPVPRRNGQFADQVNAPEGIRPMLMYEEAPPPLPKELDDELLSIIGEKVAFVHNVADNINASFNIPEIDIKEHLRECVYFTSQFLSDKEGKYLKDVATHLRNYLQKQSTISSDFGFCHADLVMSNIRLTEDEVVTFFDFGNALKTWRAYDLSVVHWSLVNRYKDRGDKLWDAFLLGYKSNRPLPILLIENLAALLVLRQIGFLGGNCATLPLRLGTEPFESGFIEQGMSRLKRLVELSGIGN